MCSLIVCSITLYCYVRIKRVYIEVSIFGRMHSNDRIDVVINHNLWSKKLFQLYWEKIVIYTTTIISYNQIFKTNINNRPMSV